jgi:methionyl-tRNA formyltransferase
MRVIFMGTPQLAVPILKRIIQSHHEVVAVITQPDKPVGRQQRIAPTPVKELAIEYGIPVLQPASLKDSGFQSEIREVKADIGVVFAYGKIIPQWLLDLPPHGLINVHVSLLPRWRGAAPIQRAIMAGDRLTGVTIMQMDAGLDTGDILFQKEIEISLQDTSGTIAEKIYGIGADLLMFALDEIEKGVVKRKKQDEAHVTYADKISDEDLEIDWCKPAEVIDNQVRGLNPKPGAYTFFDGKKLKVWRVSAQTSARVAVEERAGDETEYMQETSSTASNETKQTPMPPKSPIQRTGNNDTAMCAEHAECIETTQPGTVLAIDKKRGPVVSAGNRYLVLDEVQPESKKRITGAEFVRGYRLQVGDRFVGDRFGKE